MKSALVILILFFSTISLFAQNNTFAGKLGNNNLYASNFNYITNFKPLGFSATNFNKSLREAADPSPLIKTGKILTFIGLPLAIIGGIMVANSDALYYECVNGVCEGDPQGGFGILILASGIGMTGTGVVLWTIGKKKS